MVWTQKSDCLFKFQLHNLIVMWLWVCGSLKTSHILIAKLPHVCSGYWIKQYWSRAWLYSGSVFLASGAKTHDAHYLLQVWLCPIFSAPKIDPWVQVLSGSSIHYIDSFPTSLSFNCINSLCWSLPRSIRRRKKDFFLPLVKNNLFLFYWSLSQLTNTLRGYSKDHSMWNVLKHHRKKGWRGKWLKNNAWNGGCEPDHVGSFRTNEGFPSLFQE